MFTHSTNPIIPPVHFKKPQGGGEKISIYSFLCGMTTL